MSSSILSDYCPDMSKYTVNILDRIEVRIEVTHNPFELPVDLFFAMAARINKKRSFLFVSKMLGKHIPVNPHTSLLSGAALALLLLTKQDGATALRARALLQQALEGLRDESLAQAAYEALMAGKLAPSAPLAFIGFAETATALGHAMYNVLAERATYIHTTREEIPELVSVISFEEEHSHAVAHRCYALKPEVLSGTEPIVLVDDEITTGKTALNIIRDIQSKFPRKKYLIASLLDWRSESDERACEELQAELGIEIESICLLKGRITAVGSPPEAAPIPRDLSGLPEAELAIVHMGDSLEQIELAIGSVDSSGHPNGAPYTIATGRFGIEAAQRLAIDSDISRIATELRQHRGGERTLVMGTGEFMYVPMRIAAEMGAGVRYQSTTRSPIHTSDEPGYAVTSAQPYPSPEDGDVRHFIYNVAPGQYDDIFVIFERDMDPSRLAPMLHILRRLAGSKVHAVFLTANSHGWESTMR
ncbi:phosphoribosyltransferase family protein [Paenibacillus harenae]|uniref:phosphoribosyltransferase family protein n=1 Tax=Paenibacillus harenae TaxID=306543 RepID=UPI0027D8BCB2|nr:phosphoribosyltransferase family protein [Paenibacillus harenae]